MLTICALYQFTTLNDFETIRKPLKNKLDELIIKGTILLAKEGINGTIAGCHQAICDLLDYLQLDKRLNKIEYKFSYTHQPPFQRLKVKLKKEIVTLGITDIDPKQSAENYVDAQNWNDLITDPDVIVIDTRNDYEYQIGSFQGAINPNTQAFREFPKYSEDNLEQYRHKKMAMFCTGGIRCEKSTAYLKSQGFEKVYHLKGGILKYLEEIPQSQSLWQGDCFVFDNRVSVRHGLVQGQYDQCHACRYPITKKDKLHPYYTQGVSCPKCYGTKTQTQLNRYQEREYQTQLAKQRGQTHIGDEARQFLLQKNVFSN